jgi:hypothetical protein
MDEKNMIYLHRPSHRKKQRELRTMNILVQHNKMQIFKSMIRVHFVQVCHGYKKFNQPMTGVHQDGVHIYMPWGIITMDTTNIWHLGLQLVVAIPHEEHMPRKDILD